MTPIESKLKELEEALKVEGICSECGFEVNFRHRRGCKIEYLSVNITDETPKLIAALREAVASLGGYATLPKGAYAGPDDLYHDLGDSASVTLTSIEKILNGGK